MYKIIPFKAEHLECMDIRQHESDVLDSVGALHELANRSDAVTVVGGGKVLCCGGVVDTNHGTGEIWLIPSIYVPSMPLSFFRGIRGWVDNHMVKFNRLQTHCINDELHSRWMLFLGFNKDGVLKRYWHGVDYALWSKVGV